ASIAAVGLNTVGNKIPDAILKKNMEPLQKLESQYGLVSGAKNGQMGKWSTDGGKTFVPYRELPELQRKLIDANVGDQRTYTAKQAQKYIREHAEEYKKLEIPQKRPQPEVSEKRIPKPKVAPVAKT